MKTTDSVLRITGSIFTSLLVMILSGCEKEQVEKPNIIMIYADDLDFDELNVYENDKFPNATGLGVGRGFKDPKMLMPNIDKLADEGVVFNNFYVTTSICTPSRYSVLTGRFASRSPGFCERFKPGTHATLQWNTPLDPGESNIARILNEAGYRTGVVGKWHNSAPGIKADVAADADPFDPVVVEKIKTAYNNGIRYLEDVIGFDVADRIYFNNKEYLGVPDVMKVHNQEWLTEGALEVIDQNHNEPFSLYFPLTVPHAQYHRAWLKEDPLATPAGMLEKKPAGHPARTDVLRRLDEAGIEHRNAMATLIDDCVGLVMQKLEEYGISDNTVLIFASDHQSRGKYTCYESSRVPFIIRWPARLQPGSFTGLTANIDLLPTFTEIAGGTLPKNEIIDGTSFLQLLEGNDIPWREGLLLECSNIKAIVTPKWKYVANRPPQEVLDVMNQEAEELKGTDVQRTISWDGTKNPHKNEKGIRYGSDIAFPNYFDVDQLYNLENDIFEQVNLAYDEEYKEVVDNLKQMLKEGISTLPHTFGEFKVE